MHNILFANFKKSLPVSVPEVHSAMVKENLNASRPTGIQHLTIKEYSAVAGGPEVENEPEK